MNAHLSLIQPTAALPARPVTILIAALGGEGGGMLADWLVAAASACDLPVQSTSIPGVSQRTGATTYYVEIYPLPHAQLGGRVPVMALTPTPGAVDLMAASELIEAGRALENGYVSADCTTLVGSIHRVYAVVEKVIPGDGRIDSGRLLAALPQLAKRALLFDMAQLAQQSGTIINSVLFGAMAGSGALPLPREACEQAIRATGKGAEASLRGFAAGYAQAAGTVKPAIAATPALPAQPIERVHRVFPSETFALLDAGVARLTDYQDSAYAALYLDRLESVLALDREAGGADNGYRLTCETGRQLALWMSYEDVIRVADLKTRASRFARVRAETGAAPDELLQLTEYLKPGLDEVCSLLPPSLAQRLRDWVQKKPGREKSLSVAVRLKTSALSGFLLLRAVSGLKRWRRSTSRYHEEQALIERWLGALKRLGFAVQDLGLALEIAECARLVKGYGDTHRTGVAHFKRIFDTIIESGTETDPDKLTAAIRRARLAALSNPDAVTKRPEGGQGKTVFWLARKDTDGAEPARGCH
ncbi:indolepyruvate oxidoreductase subunit beta family protein [Herminiimonas sp. CN]|uniref:indolepyruvate oxidoreductase subunit beta family protein n=1 Tax=Herminiimonas sp. CN TaxID=1349818 RepID=UPI000686A585|nr:indolepyruvate oxidoreductase subunit beta family protein [Herminiimonas sp. CN]